MSKCPVCGKCYNEHPAISRKDNRTEICPQCGIREALSACDMSHDKAKEILEDVNELVGQKTEIFTAYSQEADITFILKDGRKSTSVVGFYYGEPDDEATRKFYGKLTAEYE